MTEKQEMLAYDLMPRLSPCIAQVRSDKIMQEIIERDKAIFSEANYAEFRQTWRELPIINDKIDCAIWKLGYNTRGVYQVIVAIRLQKMASKHHYDKAALIDYYDDLEITQNNFELALDYLKTTWKKIKRVVQLVNPNLSKTKIFRPWNTHLPTVLKGTNDYTVYTPHGRSIIRGRYKVVKKYAPSADDLNLLPKGETAYRYELDGYHFRFLPVETHTAFIVDLDDLLYGRRFVWPGPNSYVLFLRLAVEQLDIPLFRWMTHNTKKNYNSSYWVLTMDDAVNFLPLPEPYEMFEDDWDCYTAISNKWLDLHEELTLNGELDYIGA
jgi:hypothetical protein